MDPPAGPPIGFSASFLSISLFNVSLGKAIGELKRESSSGGKVYSSGCVGGLTVGCVALQPAKQSNTIPSQRVTTRIRRMSFLPAAIHESPLLDTNTRAGTIA